MKRKMLFVAACAAALWSVSAMALPSTNDVQAAVKAGDFPKAETMMQEVVAAKPQSAKAHYLYAEILAHDAKFVDAAAHARKARELDPQLGFTNDPEKFRSFEKLLEREQAGPTAATPVAPTNTNTAPPAMRTQLPAASSGIPGWVWVGGLAVITFLIFRAVSRRAMANNMGGAGLAPQGAGYGMNPGMAQPGYGPGYGQGYGPGYGQAPGGGLLRTGLAAGAGVAGGMLLEKMLEGNRHEENYGNGGAQGGGMFDSGSNQAATDLENRQIDFGSGGNDWGGDAGGGGGGSDSSGSDDGGGW